MNMVSKILSSVENIAVSLINETEGELEPIEKENFGLIY